MNVVSGRPVLPLFSTFIASQFIGVLLVMILGCVGVSLGGSIELWFGLPFLALFGLSVACVVWIARTHR